MSQAFDTPQEHTASRRKTVLYIDDNIVNVIMVKDFFSHRPMVKLLTAYNGNEGLAIARDTPLDLLMIDLHMPGMNGFEVLEQVRRNTQNTHTPCVAVSASSMQEEMARSHKGAHFDAFWSKPILLEEFMNNLDQLLIDREPALAGAEPSAREN